jgi:hypothetical protein
MDVPFGGNVWEWNESIVQEVGLDSFRSVRGGSWNDNFRHVQASVAFFQIPEFESLNLGFRVATVPEPHSFVSMNCAILGLLLVAIRRHRTDIDYRFRASRRSPSRALTLGIAPC